jgi:hypothetical protein
MSKLSNEELREHLKISEEEALLEGIDDRDGSQIGLDARDEAERIIEERLGFEDPEKSYDLFYKKLSSIKKDFLKGNVYKPIRDEISIFMKKGRIKGADSRMAENEIKEVAYLQMKEWITSNDSGDVIALFKIFRKLNLKSYNDYIPIFKPEINLDTLE